MVHLSFTTPPHGGPRQVSAEAFVLRGGQLESLPQAEPIAFGQSDGWELDRDRFARVECPDRVAVPVRGGRRDRRAAGPVHRPRSRRRDAALR